MNYVLGVFCGLAYGAAAGWLKYMLLWRPLLTGKREFDQKNIMAAQGISMLLNVIVLLSMYFLRHLLPCPFEWPLLAAAVALSLLGRLSPLRDAKTANKIASGEQEKQD